MHWCLKTRSGPHLCSAGVSALNRCQNGATVTPGAILASTYSRRFMNPYLKVSGLDIATCASLLGYSPRLFGEWAAGQRAIPPSVAAHIASVLSVDANALLSPPRQGKETEIEPAIWFKLRSQELGRADRELVFLVRQLGAFYQELEHVRSRGGSSRWKLAFEQVRQGISVEAPPREQGRLAAQIFRSLLDWNKGRSGIGELLRPSLRNLGILIVESPIIDSKIEGCAFPLAPPSGHASLLTRTAQHGIAAMRLFFTNWPT